MECHTVIPSEGEKRTAVRFSVSIGGCQYQLSFLRRLGQSEDGARSTSCRLLGVQGDSLEIT